MMTAAETYKVLKYVTVSRWRAFNITGWCLAADYSKDEGIFQEVAYSFEPL